jgi:uncharacterized protein YjbI with pentapeptide repeats
MALSVVMVVVIGAAGALTGVVGSASATKAAAGPCAIVAHPTPTHYTLCYGDHVDGDFKGRDLRFAHLVSGNFTGANFDGADLTSAHFFESTLDGAHFVRADLAISFMNAQSARDADFADANLAGAEFCEKSGSGPNVFDKAVFTKAVLVGATGRSCAVFWDADFTDAVLKGSDFTRDALVGYRAELTGTLWQSH